MVFSRLLYSSLDIIAVPVLCSLGFVKQLHAMAFNAPWNFALGSAFFTLSTIVQQLPFSSSPSS